MKSLSYSILLLFSFVLISCNTQEKKELAHNLSRATRLLHQINNENPYTIMNHGNFPQLCAMGGFPQNIQSAQFMYANTVWGNAGWIQDYVDKSVLTASKIGNQELSDELQSLKRLSDNIREYSFWAKENYYDSRYDWYISEIRNYTRTALDKIESCRQILDN